MSGWVEIERLKYKILGGLDNQLKIYEEAMEKLKKQPYSKTLLKRIELKKRINEIRYDLEELEND